MNDKTTEYYEELEPDARGFITYMRVSTADNVIVGVELDAYHPDPNNPYGESKVHSEKYNHDMHEESGTYYRDAVESLAADVLLGVRPLRRVKGARFLSQDANVLLERIEDRINKDKEE